MFLAALVAAFVVLGPATANAVRAHSAAERTAAHHCNQHHPRSCIRRAALHYHVSYGWLLRVAYCESRLNPYAHNPSGASGMFQFMPSTWAGNRYGRHSVWSAKWASLGAAYAFHRGQSRAWSCR